MADNDRKKAQGDSARDGKTGSASPGAAAKSGKGKTSTDGEGKGGRAEHRSGIAVPIAVAAAAAAAGGAAVVMVRRKRRQAEAAAEAERGKAKRPRSASRKPDDGAAKKPRVAGGGLTQQVRPDAALGAVIGGTQPRTRAEITKQVWDYIKSNGLQDATNRRTINADATLRRVFGKDQVTMFELPRLINDHVEKV
jgi:chromatin remodeling complex protein RSC6